MTDQEFALINLALEQSGGDRAVAAKALGMTPMRFKNAIRMCPSLRLRWSNQPVKFTDTNAPKPLPETEALHKPKEHQRPVTPDEERAVKAMVKEDETLKRGLSALGLTDREQELASELQKLHEKHFVRAHQLIKAGVTRVAILVQTAIDDSVSWFKDVQERLKTVEEAKRYSLVMEADIAGRHMRELMDMARRLGDSSDKTMLLEAMIRFKLKGGVGNPDKLRKPGYKYDSPTETTDVGGNQEVA